MATSEAMAESRPPVTLSPLARRRVMMPGECVGGEVGGGFESSKVETT